MKLVKISWGRVVRLCEVLAGKTKRYNADVLVGISRGGLVPVRLLSDLLGNMNVAVMKIEFYKTIMQTKDFPKITQQLNVDVMGKRVLLVDDVADTGRSLLVAKDHVKRAGAGEVRTATLHYKPTSVVKPDYYAEEMKAWLVYPWEIHETKKAIGKRKGKGM